MMGFMLFLLAIYVAGCVTGYKLFGVWQVKRAARKARLAREEEIFMADRQIVRM